MKNIVLAGVFIMMGLVSIAAPRFVTGRMVDRRNGLTDEQYEYLWSIGRNPHISQAAARDWIFRASRYQNVTNWLDVCGRTNDFAALSYRLHEQHEASVATNRVLREAALSAAALAGSFSNACERARADAASHSNRLARVTTFLIQKRDSSKLATTKSIYQAIIDMIHKD